MKKKITIVLCCVLLIFLCLQMCGCDSNNEYLEAYREEKKEELQRYASSGWWTIAYNSIFTPESLQAFETYLSEGLEKIDSAKKSAIPKIVQQTKQKMDSVDRQPCTIVTQYWREMKYSTDQNFQEAFLDENSTYGIGNIDKTWLLEHPDEKSIPVEYIMYDYTSPLWRAYIITDQVRLKEVFKTPPEIDFDKEMVFVFMFSRYASQPEDRKMTYDGQNLKIHIKHGRMNGYYNSSISQFIYSYKMAKTNITSVEVSLDYDFGKASRDSERERAITRLKDDANYYLKNNIYTPENMLIFETYLSEGLEEIENMNRLGFLEIEEQAARKLNSIDKLSCTQVAQCKISYIGGSSEKFQESFIEENSTYGIGHVDKEWLSEHPRGPITDENIVYDDTSPLWRAHIINDKKRLRRVFKTLPKVDFDKETIFVFMFSYYGNELDYYNMAYKMVYDNSKLTIYINAEPSANSDNATVQQMIYAYKIEKINLDSVEIILESF